jgi:alpha-tubulin suppressor-like RCC1 family protein
MSRRRENSVFSCGPHHTAAINEDGQVVCWGVDVHGECDVPVELGPVVAVNCGYFHTAVITQDKKVVCWGNNSYDQCDVPADLDNVVAISSGEYHLAAITESGKLTTWGSKYDFYRDDTCVHLNVLIPNWSVSQPFLAAKIIRLR